MKKAKLLKAVVSAFAAVALAATTVVTSFAYDLTINSTKTGHTYGAYQIFKGDLDGNTLSNIEWGTGVDTTTVVADLKADETIGSLFTADTYTAAEIAKILEGLSNDSAQIDAFAQVIGNNLATASKTVASSDSSTVIEGLDAGYYLIKDTATVSGEDAATKFIIRIVKNATATPKSSVPTVEKKLQDDDDNVADQWQDVADYDIGDSVPFKLTGTLPSTLADYDTYKYVFHDTLSDGLTYNSDVMVTLDGQDVTASFTVTSSGNSLTISSDDVKALGVTAASEIVVTYTATLNENAVVGLSGNPNEVYLEFSNNPNDGGSGETGSTPTDQVVVFTYELDVLKVDGEDTTTVLKDAEFKLSKDGKWLVVEEVEGKGLVVSEWVDDEAAASTLVTGEDGKIAIVGLDEGTYSLKETKAPTGYNLLSAPISLVIEASDVHTLPYTGSNASDELTAITLNGVSGDTTSGAVSTTVENNKGSVLPETGGIGTTIFYVCGGIIVAAAAVLLIVKLRKREA